jgi:uncharacterized protein
MDSCTHALSTSLAEEQKIFSPHIKSKGVRQSQALLLRFFHDPQYDFSQVRVDYINRGSPEDRSSVLGSDIVNLGSGGMEIQSEDGKKHIPFHRVLRICYQGVPTWERDAAKAEKKPL